MNGQLSINGLELNLIHPYFLLAVSKRLRHQGKILSVRFASEGQKERGHAQLCNALAHLLMKEILSKRINLMSEIIRISWQLQDGAPVRFSQELQAWQDEIFRDIPQLAKKMEPIFSQIRSQNLSVDINEELSFLRDQVQRCTQYLRFVHDYDVKNDQQLTNDKLKKEPVPKWVSDGSGLYTPRPCLLRVERTSPIYWHNIWQGHSRQKWRMEIGIRQIAIN